MGLRINSKGITVDQYGREFNLDDKELELRREKFKSGKLYVPKRRGKFRYERLK